MTIIDSLLDGSPSPEEYMVRAKELGMTHLSQTNHGTLSGIRHFQRAAKEAGIIPILGCLMPGQEIHTIDGMKCVEDIVPGDMVLTHKGRFRPVVSTMSRVHHGKVYDINLARNGSRAVTLTDEHPVLVDDGNGFRKWVRADEIVAGRRTRRRGFNWNSYAVVPKTTADDIQTISPALEGSKSKDSVTYIDGEDYVSVHPRAGRKVWPGWGRGIALDENTAYFLGLYVADGSTYKDGRGHVNFTFNIGETDLSDAVGDWLDSYGVNYRVVERPDESTREVIFCHGPLSRLLARECGLGAHNKKVPSAIYSSPLPVIEAFLRGLADGDGKYISGSGGVYLKTASRKLAWGVKALVVNIGTFTEPKVVKSILNGKEFTHYSVQWTFSAKFKRSIERHDAVLIGIRSCVERDYCGLVYNFEVEEDNSYVSDFAIHNCEAYISPTDMYDRRSKAKRQDGTDVYNHATILALDEPGLKTLSRLSEKAWMDGFYFKPRMDTELIMSDNEGIIVLSGCLNGLIPKAIERGDMVYARNIAKQYKEGLGDRFYIEVQGHNPQYMNKALLEIADSFDIPAVATSDCHYARKDELWFQEAMLILSTYPKKNPNPDMSKMEKMDVLDRFNYLYPDRKMTFQDIEIYLRGYDDHVELFKKQGIERTDIFENTVEIGNRIGEYPYYQGLDLLPRPERSEDEVLKELARAGMDKRGFSGNKEYEDRLEYELDIIHKKKFESYFIVVADMVQWAKDEGVPVGPGRGSSAGSLLNYVLGITDVDPIEHDLTFSRFLDESRSDMPDIDVDFSDEGRKVVKQYLINKYGHAASIATFPTFKGKSAIRSAASVLGVPVAEVNKALKGSDYMENDFFDFFEGTPEGKEFIKKHPLVMELANFLEGRIRTGGMHPAGMVISKEPLSEYMPIQTGVDPNDKQGPRVEYIALDMEEVADVGGIKIDILGLKNLRVLDNAKRLIRERHGKDIDMLKIPLNDKKTYKMLADGKTLAVFQAEGPAFTKWIKETKCDNFTDIVNGTAIARPGAMDSIGPDYKAALLGKKGVNYPNKIIHDITGDTLSFIIFQEQVMRMVTDLAGMSPGDANKIRKIIGKKKDVSEFDEFRDKFIEGASKHITKTQAAKYWKDFEKHANYSFAKSHAVAYSYVTYWTAWFKANYPLEYMTSVIAAEDDSEVRTNYLLEARRMGIKVWGPRINDAQVKASIVDDGIMLGLEDIKYIAKLSAEKIIKYRPYSSYTDFVERAKGINSRMIDALNKIGAAVFDDNPMTGEERSNAYEYLGIPAFPDVDIPDAAKDKMTKLVDYDESETSVVLAMVRSVTRKAKWARVSLLDDTGAADVFIHPDDKMDDGRMYVLVLALGSVIRAIPVEKYNDEHGSVVVHYLEDKLPAPDQGKETVIGMKVRETKAGKKMATAVLMDENKQLHALLVFPGQFSQALGKLMAGREVDIEIGETKDGTRFIDGFRR